MTQSRERGQASVDQAVSDWEMAERCFAPLPMIVANVLTDKDLQSLRVPLSFLVGENEKVYSARKAVERPKRVAPQIKTIIIPHAEHDLWIVQADDFTTKILSFLDEHERKEVYL